jgi:mpaB/rubber oxygenase-like protein
MSSEQWTDKFLDDMRLRGDEPADKAVEALYTRHELDGVQHLMNLLVRNDDVPHADLPGEIKDYLANTPDVPAPSRDTVLAGQQLFAEYGSEMAMLLAFCSLPVAYSARKGVQVLYRTGYLSNRPLLRVAQTSQMILDVMTPGGLDPDGLGRRSAQKVRLMHAAVRYLLRNDPKTPWPDEYGFPINQEDLAGTLMSFSVGVLRGLEKLQIDVTREQAHSYIETWNVVGRMMGIAEALIPSTVVDANALTDRIFSRQFKPSREGRLLTDALRDVMKSRIVPGFRGLVDAMFRYLLPVEVADGFGIPHRPLEAAVIEAGIPTAHWLDVLLGGAARRRMFREFSIEVLRVLTFVEAGGRRTRFNLPPGLHGV